jgi:hypothetical protein
MHGAVLNKEDFFKIFQQFLSLSWNELREARTLCAGTQCMLFRVVNNVLL